MTKLAFDIGMYNGDDSRYLLHCGFNVVAVEAHPGLCQAASERFADAVAEKRMTIVNTAIAAEEGMAELSLCRDDPGSSSTISGKLEGGRRDGTLKVPATTIGALLARHGTPTYLKVDIEGADRHCILPLIAERAPRYLSFEVDDDVEELVRHAAAIGYSGFKLIGQTSFLEMGRERGVGYRLRNRAMKFLGYGQPRMVRRHGQWFTLEHSTGPGPWDSDGGWYSAEVLLRKWHHSRARGIGQGWYDVHAIH